MANKNLVKGEFVKTITFTLLPRDIRKLEKLSKRFKSRSEAMRHIIGEAYAKEKLSEAKCN